MQKSAFTGFFSEAIGATVGIGLVELVNNYGTDAPRDLLIYQAIVGGLVLATFSAGIHNLDNCRRSLGSRLVVVTFVALLAVCIGMYLGAFAGWSLLAVAAIAASIAVIGGFMHGASKLLGQ
jgi:hypothetical protein